MFQYILSCLYFFLPAYIANMAPPLIRKAGIFKFLDKPVDFEKNLFGRPIFGSHKTWRGAVFSIITGISIVFLQFWLSRFSLVQKISFLNYQEINILFFGFLISAGAVFGDLLFAFFKRRLKMAPGAPWFPFDQTNYVIGAFLFLFLLFKISYFAWLTIFILTFLLHIIVNWIGYLLGISRNKW